MSNEEFEFEKFVEQQRREIEKRAEDAKVEELTTLANQFLKSNTSVPEGEVEEAREKIDNMLPAAKLQNNIPLLTALARLSVALEQVKVETREEVLRRDGDGSKEYPYTGRRLDDKAHNAARDRGESYFSHNGVTIRVVGKERKVSLANPEDKGRDWPEEVLARTAKILKYEIE